MPAEDPVGGNGGNLRRRHSAHSTNNNENEEPGAGHQDGVPERIDHARRQSDPSTTVQTRPEPPGRTARTETVDTLRPHRSDSEDSTPRDRPRVATDNNGSGGNGASSPRVRFSADIQELSPRSINAAVTSGSGSVAQRRHSSDTRSPPTMTSPTSPQARDRGYSLRRSLFNRRVRDGVDGVGGRHEGMIELQDTGGDEISGGGDGLATGNGLQTSRADHLRKRSGDSPAIASPIAQPRRRSENGGKAFSTTSTGLDEADETGRGGSRSTSAILRYRKWIRKRARRNPIVYNTRETYHRLRRFVLRMNEIPPSKDGRHILLNIVEGREKLIDERTGREYVGNTIRSSRYTAWSFLPRQLFAQFSKLANFYFLCVSILQLIPGLSTTGTFTTLVPLLIFVSISIAKEGYDDLRRYKLDKSENNREGLVMGSCKPRPPRRSDTDGVVVPTTGSISWTARKWKDLKVGDLVKLERNDAAPADIVVLYSSGANGVAFVETMALDGETNLKSKQAAPSVSKVCLTEDDVVDVKAELVVEDPNLDLYNFEGKLAFNRETSPLTNGEIILRGSVLRNTPSTVGMIIYTGEECKIRMNATKNPRIKAPTLQSFVNKIVILIVIFVLLLAIGNTVAYQIWSANYEDQAWYLTNADVAFFPVLASFFIMFNTMIPLSLYVSLEIVKVCQMFLLNDIDMYDEVSNTPFEARTSTINEELGQVNYIFSDKTGTLTDNVMKFRKMSVAGTSWLHDIDLAESGSENRMMHRQRKNSKKSMQKNSRLSRSLDHRRKSDAEAVPKPSLADDATEPVASPTADASKWTSSARPAKSQLERRTEDMVRYLQQRPHTVFAKKARLFLLSMALCHTCLPEVQEDGAIDFQASSPDELALVRAARELGYLAINRDVGNLTIKSFPSGVDADPIEEVYRILDVIEFSSKRKRMSVVVRFPDQRICVICKGADSIIMQLLKLATLANEKVVEIERRATVRKSMEAQHAMRRKSEQVERKGSVPRVSFASGRPSFALGRPSMGSVRRPSGFGASKPQAVRDEMDAWLRDRERDGDVASPEPESVYCTPRTSAHLGRHSAAFSEPRRSMTADELNDDLVNESLVLDERAVIERCLQHINDFATEGLRTLLYGYRFMDESEYREWKAVYLDATTSLVDRQNKIEQAGEMVERDFDLAGATAIEDKLQDGVPQAIDKLRRANIKMWMLTGDKRETAINIGHSCRLIKEYSTVTVLDHEAGGVEEGIASAVAAINGSGGGGVAHSVIVIDGQTLATIDADRRSHKLFLELAILADAVVCCRASPSQKASLVNSIRRKAGKSVTLAIGDGANDIAMIQEAHVGIGITGKEGLQAARTSDYSIAQFRFLTKLLLVHGRWNYIRTCKYTVGTFWKEMLFYLTQALYQRSDGYTGTSFYESWSLSMFNTLFTSLPVIFLGIFEKDLRAATLLAVPELYSKGQRNGGFNLRTYLGWVFMAAAEAMIVFYCMLGLYGGVFFTDDQSLFAMGDLTFTACVIIISAKLQFFEIHNKSITAGIAIFLSVGGWFLWNMILAATYTDNVIYYVRDAFFERFGRNALWWLTLIIILVSVAVFELGIRAIQAAFFATDVDIFQALEHDPPTRRRFEEAAASELQAGWRRYDNDRAEFSLPFVAPILRAFCSVLPTRRHPSTQRHTSATSGAAVSPHAKQKNAEDSSDHSIFHPRSRSAEREHETETAEEKEIRELLERRPELVERKSSTGTPRRSIDVAELLRRGFGSVREEQQVLGSHNQVGGSGSTHPRTDTTGA